jgi:hypothetical protein
MPVVIEKVLPMSPVHLLPTSPVYTPLFQRGKFRSRTTPLWKRGEGVFGRSEGELWLELLGQVINS